AVVDDPRHRVVVDTNLFVGGTIIRRGVPFLILEAWRDWAFRLVMPVGQRRALAETLAETTFAHRYGVTASEVAGITRRVTATAGPTSDHGPVPVVVRDPDDIDILVSAIAADFLVTGDNDLLVLADDPRLAPPKIPTPRAHLDRLNEHEAAVPAR
ncbi:MAG: hypothetical protein AVDCRST_MAG73-390, partial [uncultured Thermomicrobiales bacterium]